MKATLELPGNPAIAYWKIADDDGNRLASAAPTIVCEAAMGGGGDYDRGGWSLCYSANFDALVKLAYGDITYDSATPQSSWDEHGTDCIMVYDKAGGIFGRLVQREVVRNRAMDAALNAIKRAIQEG